MRDQDKTKEQLLRELSILRREEQNRRHTETELIRAEKLSFAGRIAASVAHEIRNPLNIIAMAVQQLHDELGKNDPKREYTESIIKNIDRVSNLITEFVNAARPPKLKMQWKDINKILEDILKLMQPKFQERRAELIKELSPDLPKIKVDDEHITQAFMNILTNACDALPRKDAKIWLNSKRDGDYIMISFRNTGKPIPQKDIIRIFDPFFSKKKKGIGLGLSITYSVIGSHWGSISVESNKDIGTVFTVRLPLADIKSREKAGSFYY